MAVLVCREIDRFTAVLRENGFDVINLPMIRTERLHDLTDFREKLDHIDDYECILITSRNSAEALLEIGGPGFKFSGTIYVLGERSRALLNGGRFKLNYSKSANTITELIKELGTEEFAGKRLLFIRGRMSLRTIPQLLGSIAKIDEAEVYDTLSLSIKAETRVAITEMIESGEIGWVCFFSPSAIEAFVDVFGSPESLKVAAIGTTTADAARSHSFNVGFVADTATAEGFGKGFSKYLREH